MRKLISTTFVTLDGVMQAPGAPEEDASGGFTYGGWQAPFPDDAVGDFINEIMGEPFDLLLGRKTYDIFASYWPFHADTPIGAAFEKATKYVASRSQIDLKWEDSQLVEGDVVDYVRRLKQDGGPNLHTWGSADLIQTLLDGGVLDEMRVLTYPVILGPGKRLFGGENTAQKFDVTCTSIGSTGVMMAVYQPAGEVETGTMSA
jgi:dihydrofolate reductase